MSSKYRLVMRSGPTSGESINLDKNELFIGRDLSNDIVVNDPEVSRRHVRLFLQGDQYVIEDLGSTNGTSVNGQRLMGPYILRPGELVTMGEHVNMLYETDIDDVGATVVSGAQPGGQPATVRAPQQVPQYQQVPEPARAPSFSEVPDVYSQSAPPPVNHTPAVPPAAAEAYTPAVSAGEDAPPKKRKVWLIVLVILLAMIICCVIGLFVVDSMMTPELYCDYLGDVLNMASPGMCP
jgi:predicted component of type VI protein secretion system